MMALVACLSGPASPTYPRCEVVDMYIKQPLIHALTLPPVIHIYALTLPLWGWIYALTLPLLRINTPADMATAQW